MRALVQWLARGKARGVAVAVALVVVAVASACGGAGGGQKSAKPVITPKEAVTVVMRVQTRRIDILQSEDASRLAGVDSGPELSVDRNAIQEAKAQATSLTAVPYTSVIAIVPKQTVYPAWYMAVVRDAQGGTGLDLLTRVSPTDPWTLSVGTGASDGAVNWKREPGGWAEVSTPSVDSSQKLADYWNNALTGVPVGGVTPGTMTSGVASSLASTTSSDKSKGWAVVVSFSSVRIPMVLRPAF